MRLITLATVVTLSLSSAAFGQAAPQLGTGTPPAAGDHTPVPPAPPTQLQPTDSVACQRGYIQQAVNMMNNTQMRDGIIQLGLELLKCANTPALTPTPAAPPAK